MGQTCNCVAYDHNKKAISNLELLRNNNEKEKEKLKAQYILQKERYDKCKKYALLNKSNIDKIDKLTNEKRSNTHIVKSEKRKAQMLQDTITKYKSQIDEMENTINTLKHKKEQLQSNKDRLHAPITRRHTEIASPKSKNSSLITRRQRANDDSYKPIFERIGESLQIPNFTGLSLSNRKTEPLPFKVKNRKKRTDSASDSKTTDDISNDENKPIQMRDTIELDAEYSPVEDAAKVYSWLSEQKADGNGNSFFQFDSSDKIKQLKVNLAELFTSRSQGHRQKIIEIYYTQYNSKLEKDIQNIIQKGHALEIIHGLLTTPTAKYEAELINEYVTDWDIEPVADIICCKNMFELQELCAAYKKKCKLDLKKQLISLANQNKKKTLCKVIGNILDLNRKEDMNVAMNEVNTDINFMLTESNFKNENKKRLIVIFTSNSVQYIKVLNDQFKLKSNDSLTEFIDNKLGSSSTAGYFCKTRILYALDTPVYYAQIIKNLGKSYKKNQKKIADIFIQRMEIDLELIQRIWKIKKYADGQSLKDWIKEKTDGKKSGYFLTCMLQNCSRYAAFRKHDNAKPKSKFEQMMIGN